MSFLLVFLSLFRVVSTPDVGIRAVFFGSEAAKRTRAAVDEVTQSEAGNKYATLLSNAPSGPPPGLSPSCRPTSGCHMLVSDASPQIWGSHEKRNAAKKLRF